MYRTDGGRPASIRSNMIRKRTWRSRVFMRNPPALHCVVVRHGAA